MLNNVHKLQELQELQELHKQKAAAGKAGHEQLGLPVSGLKIHVFGLLRILYFLPKIKKESKNIPESLKEFDINQLNRKKLEKLINEFLAMTSKFNIDKKVLKNTIEDFLNRNPDTKMKDFHKFLTKIYNSLYK